MRQRHQAGKGGGPSPFSNAFSAPAINSLRYNTSQAGSPLPIVYGTQRLTVNLIEEWGFSSSASGGKGGGGGSSGGKKSSDQNYSVNLAAAICQGPVSFAGASHGIGGNNRVWSNGGIAAGLGNIGLNGYDGNDGQALDPVFQSSDPNSPAIGYSGTCYVTGTPIYLGASPAIPSIQFEVTGVGAGTAGASFPDDACPADIVDDLLTNPRYGAGFPTANYDGGGSISDWGTYCRAAGLAMSLVLDRVQPAARWLQEIAELTASAVVWSGALLKIIPYGDGALNAYGYSWTPNLTWRYSFTDDDYLDFGGGSDPVIVTRKDPAEMTNWLDLEYQDSANSYNVATLPAQDQALIDLYGVRSEASVTAHALTNPTSAQISANLQLQRKAYIRTSVQFKLGWRYSLLEPMDIVLVTDAKAGLQGAAFRVVQIDEDDNGELTVTCEEIPGLTP